ncbi:MULTISPECIES: hypothetical protein [Marinobacter]|uniref:hypothetical protein n=1 Tax=Marinobacter TaxID=2742 RepID=UPI001268AF93|nr:MULTISPECIES: hypothetical protein [unclassified Marinobacter]QFS86610.1 hypothetical protein FIV08_07160 [Marinobacter sp. THAF197a]QFT50394.1 hypothetical protein FIU96_07090 [Marinobacter sp. THAF39]QFT52916.1 hypothetical protein FIU96_19895 [Marinobacter sp. THAF39]
MDENTVEENVVRRAFTLAVERYDSMAIVCGILDVSNSYVYIAMNKGELSLPCSLKMEVMLDGEITWRELCPKVAKEVDAVKDRVTQYK